MYRRVNAFNVEKYFFSEKKLETIFIRIKILYIIKEQEESGNKTHVE